MILRGFLDEQRRRCKALLGFALHCLNCFALLCSLVVLRVTAYLALSRSSTKSKLLALLCFALRAFALQRPVAFVKHRLHCFVDLLAVALLNFALLCFGQGVKRCLALLCVACIALLCFACIALLCFAY